MGRMGPFFTVNISPHVSRPPFALGTATQNVAHDMGASLGRPVPPSSSLVQGVLWVFSSIVNATVSITHSRRKRIRFV